MGKTRVECGANEPPRLAQWGKIGKTKVRRAHPRPPSLLRQGCCDACSSPALAERDGCCADGRAEEAEHGRLQGGREYLIRIIEADRCRPPERRLCRGGSRPGPTRDSAARLALRHQQRLPCRSAAR